MINTKIIGIMLDLMNIMESLCIVILITTTII